jgi:hypothetical protein
MLWKAVGREIEGGPEDASIVKWLIRFVAAVTSSNGGIRRVESFDRESTSMMS